MDNDNPVKELIDEQLASDINEILETVEAGVESFTTHTKDLNNPHQVTKEQVGLGNVDNTSDLDKPISNAVSSAIKSLEGKISGVDSAVKTLENKVDSAVNTLNTKVDSAVKTLENKVDSAVNTLNDKLSSSSETFNSKIEEVKSSVKTLDSKINSAVNTINGDIAQVKSSVETFKHEINSAIQTLEHEFDSDLETAKQEILDVVDGFKVNLDFIATSVETLKSQTQSAIETNKTEVLNTVSGIKTNLQSAIETHKANTDSAVNTLNQNLNSVKSALQTHNHDGVYVKVGSGGSNTTTITTNEYGTWRETPLSDGTVLLEGHGLLKNNTDQQVTKTVNLLKQCKLLGSYKIAGLYRGIFGVVRTYSFVGADANALILTGPDSFNVNVPAAPLGSNGRADTVLWWEFVGYIE